MVVRVEVFPREFCYVVKISLLIFEYVVLFYCFLVLNCIYCYVDATNVFICIIIIHIFILFIVIIIIVLII